MMFCPEKILLNILLIFHLIFFRKIKSVQLFLALSKPCCYYMLLQFGSLVVLSLRTFCFLCKNSEKGRSLDNYILF